MTVLEIEKKAEEQVIVHPHGLYTAEQAAQWMQVSINTFDTIKETIPKVPISTRNPRYLGKHLIEWAENLAASKAAAA